MYYPDEVIEELRNRNDIVGVISQAVHLEKKGSRYFGLCPFHSEKTGSFCVSPDRQMYYCFGCGAGGNVISFVMSYENMSFQEAVESLAERAGMELPKQSAGKAEREKADRKARMMAAYKDAAVFYYKQLRQPQGSRAMEYFARRGLTAETMNKFGLGYAPQSPALLYRYLKERGYTDDLINESQLLKVDERGSWDRFYNRAIFPIMDVRSRVIGFGGRVMGSGEPKYLNSPETPIFDKSRNLFGLNLAKSSRRPYMLLCEGYMDVIALHQAGFDCAVASLGTAFTSGHAALIKRYVSEVIITYDSDGAGQKAALRAIPILRAAGLRVKVLDMRPHKDPDEFIVHLGAEEYEKRISEAKGSFFFETDVMASRYDMNDPESKTSFHRELASALTAFSDSLERENYLTAVAARYSIPADHLREMVSFMGRNRTGSEADSDVFRSRASARKEKGRGLLSAERTVLCWLCSTETPYEKIISVVRPEYFSGEVLSDIAERIFARLSEGKRIDPASLIDEYSDDPELRLKASAIFGAELPEDEKEAREVLSDNLRIVRKAYINNALRSASDPARLQELMLEKASADKMTLDGII